MAKLADDARESVRASVTKKNREPISLGKSQVRKVVDTMDDFIDESVATFKARLDAAGATLSDNQLDLILAGVAQKRIEERV